MTGHSPDHIMTTTVGTDLSPLTTDAAKEDTLISQDHTTSPTTAEAPATTGEMHPTPHSPSCHHSSSCYPSTD